MNIRPKPDLIRQFSAMPPSSIPEGYYQDSNGHLKRNSEECDVRLARPKLRRFPEDSKFESKVSMLSPNDRNIVLPKESDLFSPREKTVLSPQSYNYNVPSSYDHEAHEARVCDLMRELAKYNIYDSSIASAAAVERGNCTAEGYAVLYEEELKKMIEKVKEEYENKKELVEIN